MSHNPTFSTFKSGTPNELRKFQFNFINEYALYLRNLQKQKKNCKFFHHNLLKCMNFDDFWQCSKDTFKILNRIYGKSFAFENSLEFSKWNE